MNICLTNTHPTAIQEEVVKTLAPTEIATTFGDLELITAECRPLLSDKAIISLRNKVGRIPFSILKHLSMTVEEQQNLSIQQITFGGDDLGFGQADVIIAHQCMRLDIVPASVAPNTEMCANPNAALNRLAEILRKEDAPFNVFPTECVYVHKPCVDCNDRVAEVCLGTSDQFPVISPELLWDCLNFISKCDNDLKVASIKFGQSNPDIAGWSCVKLSFRGSWQKTFNGKWAWVGAMNVVKNHLHSDETSEADKEVWRRCKTELLKHIGITDG